MLTRKLQTNHHPSGVSALSPRKDQLYICEIPLQSLVSEIQLKIRFLKLLYWVLIFTRDLTISFAFGERDHL